MEVPRVGTKMTEMPSGWNTVDKETDTETKAFTGWRSSRLEGRAGYVRAFDSGICEDFLEVRHGE